MAATAKAILEIGTDLSSYEAGLAKAGSLGKQFAKDMEALGKGISGVGKEMTKWVTGPIVGVTAGIGALVVGMSDSGNAIAKSAREAGLAAGTYQELKFAIGQVGKLTEEQVDTAFRKLTLTIGDAATGTKAAQNALKDLGFTSAEIASGTIGTEDAFNRLSVAMQGSESQAQAAAMAGELVGVKVGPGLAAALRESGGQIDTLRGQFRDLGLGMSQETLDASETFVDQMDVMGRQFSALGGELAGELLPIFTDDLMPMLRDDLMPMLKNVVTGIGDGVKWFRGLGDETKLLIGGAVGLAAALGPVLMVVGPLVSGIGALSGVMVALALNPVVLSLLAIAAAFTAVKIAVDISTAAARRNIQMMSDHKVITDGFNSTTKLSEEELKKVKEALDRVHAAHYVGAKGVGVMDKSVQGLNVQILSESEALGENAKASMAAAAAALRAAGATGDASTAADAAAKAQNSYNAELQKMADQMTGKSLAAEVTKLADALALAEKRGGLTAHELDKLGKTLAGLGAQGAKLPPPLAAIETRFYQLNVKALPLISTLQSVNTVLAQMKSVALSLPPAIKLPQMSLSGIDLMGPNPIAQSILAWQDSLPVGAAVASAGKKTGDGFAASLSKTLEGLGSVIVGAFQGGGDIGKSIGASLGNSMGASLGAALAKSIGGSLGKMLGGFAGPLGALLGGKLGDLVGGLFAGNDTKKDRESAAKMMGFSSIGAMNTALNAMGAEGQKLVHEGLNTIGKKDTAANQAWIESVKALFAAQEVAARKAAEATEAAAAREVAATEKVTSAIQDKIDTLDKERANVFESIREELENPEYDEAGNRIYGVIEAQGIARLAQLDEERKALEIQLEESKTKVLDTAAVVREGIEGLFKDPIVLTFDLRNFPTTTGRTPAFGGAMAAGGVGHVTRPTWFLAGEKPGGEDFMFSGVGKRFAASSGGGGGRMNTTPLVIQADGRTLARVMVQHAGEELRLAGY